MNNPTYKGWEIDIWEDREEDNIKLFHDARKDGKSMMLDLSPYGTWDYDLCAAMIDLGLPSRETIDSIGPLHREDVETLWRAKFGDKPMPTIDILAQL